ncbi:MAG: hypothetical protein ACM3WT_02185, partial [Bacillota bacterium]
SGAECGHERGVGGKACSVDSESAWDHPSAEIFREQGNQHGDDLVLRIQKVMYEGVGVVRSSTGLQAALQQLDRLREEAVEAAREGSGIDALNLALTGMITARCALERRETRGTHVRTDFPSTCPGAPLHLAATRGDEEGDPFVRAVPVD